MVQRLPCVRPTWSDVVVNNREKATVIWFGIALLACLFSRDVRRSLWQVVKVAAQPMILGPLVALAAWTAGLVALAHLFGLWEADERNDTIAWFITVGIVLLFSLGNVKEDGFFRTAVRRAVAGAVFVEAFVNLAAFPLGVELVLVPVLAVLGMVSVVAASKEEYAPAATLVRGMLSIIGLSLILYAIITVAGDSDVGHTLRTLALPVWLTVGVLPFIYALGLWSEYQTAFARIDLRTDEREHRRRAKRALFRAANLRASEVGGFTGRWIGDVCSAKSDAEAAAVMKRWRQTWRLGRQGERLEESREYMNEWLSEDDPVCADIYRGALHESWQHLDSAQRAALKAEGAEAASTPMLLDELVALPD